MLEQIPQDELAELLQRNLSLNAQNPSTPNQQFSFQPTTQQPITYISQHYTQTAHIRARASSEPSTPSDELKDEYFAATLRQHDIDPQSLFPAQIELFRAADYDQRLRLLELWRIAPPDFGSPEFFSQLHQAQTTLAQEEFLAKRRYERRLQQRDQNVQSSRQHPSPEVEPYMAKGYQESNPGRTDPVYAASTSSNGLWQPPAYPQEDMENQYGAYEQARVFERLQSLHQEVDTKQTATGYDDDMVM